MYLKSIDVQGFKSFANKIRFELLNGITCIVGPNGSGKSNVADAVRWVFGEQSSRQLRSTGMPDLIFAGTELRKPQSFAEVAITLDNSDRALNFDADEVVVSRKVYRSGESEYRLNGAICRLKDINELFYDTGIGKEGYSIIGQGQVDKILSARPDERREIFDEACGIVKFKKRKKETLKSLEAERENMVRVGDILGELERHVGPLKRQSETAKEYLKLRDELRSYDINAFLIDEKALNDTLSSIRNDLVIANGHLEEERAKEASVRENYQKAEETLSDLEAKLAQVRSAIQSASSERAEKEHSIVLLEEKINHEAQQRAQYEQRIAELTASGEEKSGKISELSAKLTECAASLESMRSLVREHESTLLAKQKEIELYEEAVRESEGKVLDYFKERSDVNGRLNALRTKFEQGGLRLHELTEKLDELKDQLATLKTDSEASVKTCESMAQDLIEKNDALTASEADLDEANETYQKDRATETDLQQKIQIAKGRLEALKAIRERYEGFQPAVRKIMEDRKRFPGIRGTVAELITVDKEYQTLIETALGGNFQNIVTDTEATAKAVVDYLKETRAGRATFLPVDSIRSGGGIQNAAVLHEPGVIGTCDRLVRYDRSIKNVIEYLLDRFLAVDTMDHALAIARKYRYTVRIVTLEGEFLNVGGSITGGSYRNGANVLGRNDEIERLEKTIRTDESELEKLQAGLAAAKQFLDSCVTDKESLTEEIQNLQIELASEKANADHLLREIALRTTEQEEAKSRKIEIEGDVKEATLEIESIERALKNLEKTNTDTENAKGETEKMLRSHRDEAEALKKAAEEARLELTKAEQSSAFYEESIETLRMEIVRAKEDEALLRQEIEDSETRTKEHETEKTRIAGELQAAGDGNDGLSDTLDILTTEKEKASKAQSSLFDERGQIADTLNSIEKEIVRLEAQQERSEEKLENLTAYLWTEYELTPSEAQEYVNHELDDEPPSKIRRKAQELKNAIKALGSVNVNAIDEYKEVSERYEFLSAQYADIQKAEASLVESIEELDKGMRRQFTEEFEKIREQFDIVYKDLFRGGSASLVISPDEDIIDADIKILSQPPGKRLPNMMQLSGGEKALTAIALIFAIQNLKPSPFCMLDEIEAALDDTNIVRFTNYLKQLADKTQYIVITHRRGTMVAANRLYGITMQEKGVSALVSVNLVENQLD